jgi:hypothetical protein
MPYFSEDIRPRNFKNHRKENIEKACQKISADISKEIKQNLAIYGKVTIKVKNSFDYEEDAIKTVSAELVERGFKVSIETPAQDPRDFNFGRPATIITITI